MGVPVRGFEVTWMLPERADREARVLEFYRGRGVQKAEAFARRDADSLLVNLCGDCGPLLGAIEAGHDVGSIAVVLGVSKKAVYQYLMEHAPVEWGRLMAAGAAERLEDASLRLEKAETNVEVTREAALARTAQWSLERLAPRLFGARGDGGVVVNVVLDPSCGGGVVLDSRVVPGAEASVLGQEG